MRHSRAVLLRRPSVRGLFAMLFLTAAGSGLSALDLTLNGRSHALIPQSALDAWMTDGEIPLKSLYPWMMSIDSLEVTSGTERFDLDAPQLGVEEWNSARLVRRGEGLELRAGGETISAPDRIAIRGVRREVGPITILWSADNPEYRRHLDAALALRGVRVDWVPVSSMDSRLSDPPAGPGVYLAYIGDLEAIELAPMLGASQPVAGRLETWPEGTPTADFLYTPAAPLHVLLSVGTGLFTADGTLAPGMTDFLSWAAGLRKAGRKPAETADTMTDTDSSTMGENQMDAVAVPPAAATDAPDGFPLLPPGFADAPPPPFLRLEYLAMPDGTDEELGLLILSDAARTAAVPGGPEGAVLPQDPRLPRFYDAYERIGRLAISGQLDIPEAVELMNRYIAGNER